MMWMSSWSWLQRDFPTTPLHGGTWRVRQRSGESTERLRTIKHESRGIRERPSRNPISQWQTRINPAVQRHRPGTSAAGIRTRAPGHHSPVLHPRSNIQGAWLCIEVNSGNKPHFCSFLGSFSTPNSCLHLQVLLGDMGQGTACPASPGFAPGMHMKVTAPLQTIVRNGTSVCQHHDTGFVLLCFSSASCRHRLAGAAGSQVQETAP